MGCRDTIVSRSRKLQTQGTMGDKEAFCAILGRHGETASLFAASGAVCGHSRFVGHSTGVWHDAIAIRFVYRRYLHNPMRSRYWISCHLLLKQIRLWQPRVRLVFPKCESKTGAVPTDLSSGSIDGSRDSWLLVLQQIQAGAILFERPHFSKVVFCFSKTRESAGFDSSHHVATYYPR